MSFPVEHRPWPLPRGPWAMAQTWRELLFAHWPVPTEALRAVIPPQLDLDTFEGRAYLSVVPFRMTGIRLRGLPPVPGTSAFPELNVRTYVRIGARPGVWFFSLDAANRVAVAAARRWFHLPYYRARMESRRDGEQLVYASERRHAGAPAAVFRGRYRPSGDATPAEPGRLDHWLTERYCLYALDPRGGLWRGEIHHAPWPLRPAVADLDAAAMVRAAGLPSPEGVPLLHYAERLDVRIWPLRRA